MVEDETFNILNLAKNTYNDCLDILGTPASDGHYILFTEMWKQLFKTRLLEFD